MRQARAIQDMRHNRSSLIECQDTHTHTHTFWTCKCGGSVASCHSSHSCIVLSVCHLWLNSSLSVCLHMNSPKLEGAEVLTTDQSVFLKTMRAYGRLNAPLTGCIFPLVSFLLCKREKVPFECVCSTPLGNYMIPANIKTNMTLYLKKVNINLDLDPKRKYGKR